MSAAAAASGKAGGERADLGAWLAVSAGTVGALMATLDISITNAALPDIQGGIGASGTEGTWVSTAYLVAEIVIIPLTGFMERLFGLRTFLLLAVVLFTLFSMLCGISHDLPTMIFGRVGQGFTGGALIPTAMTIIATRLPPAQQPIGTAAFGATAVLGPVTGPVLGGWLTETYSWHYAFFINLPVGVLMVALLLIGLPHKPANPSVLKHADWLGILGLAMGLGGLTVVLEEGQREQWFGSDMIRKLSVVAAVGFVLLLLGQLVAREPVIKLRLLFKGGFGAVFLMALAVGAMIYGVSYLIPQYLNGTQDYNAFQSGQVVSVSGVPSLFIMPLMPWLMRTVDVRLAVAVGLAILSASCWLDAYMTAEYSGPQFTGGQILRGIGQLSTMLFLNQAAVSATDKEDASDAAGLFNAARNLGGSLALAAISTLQDQRGWLHQRRIESTLHANDVRIQDYLSNSAAMLGGGDPVAGQARAFRALGNDIQLQATVMVFNDLFFLLACATLACIPLVLFLRPLPKGQGMAAG